MTRPISSSESPPTAAASASSSTSIDSREIAPSLAPGLGVSLWGRLRETAATAEGRSELILAALGSVLLAGLFWPTLVNFVFIWSTNENYSHGFLVPLLSLYFANEASKKARGRLNRSGGATLGFGLVATAVLGRWANVLVPIGLIGDLAFLVGLAGVATLFLGRDGLKRYGFALGFLVFMVPLPVALYSAIASPLQLAVSKIAAGLLNLSGIPVLREGNLMILPGDIRMFVAEACSGMRQLTGFLALSAAIAHSVQRPWWFKAVVVASSVPIAMTANVLRVMLTGFIMYKIDPEFALGAWHTAEGLALMAVGLGLLMLELWALNQALVFDEPPDPKGPGDGGALGGGSEHGIRPARASATHPMVTTLATPRLEGPAALVPVAGRSTVACPTSGSLPTKGVPA
ncbi:eight transmembrane protein EpsH [Isosphaera pallida ATCC 43644]|uniref:Eight transmembrane protein EpsH n=1 Tax=Isosphaera pallida (strain ATCC 43644 / DSM 9630 / IS1B) TaxID=575540 RepID=E8R397_ISOPI|nr:exosortase/archaeosortase family protein [Isosphaera pallida]ADV63607.1 eight transmembrane protein EpsH [Isosphaera pallida ATCC 43644]